MTGTNMRGMYAVIGLLFFAHFPVETSAMETGMNELKRLQSAYPFAETVRKLRAGLADKGFTIFAAIDQQDAARSAGLAMPPTTLLVYGNPRGGTPLMLAVPDFGIELPLKVLVREDAGGIVFVVFVPARALQERYGLPAELAAKLAGAEPVIAAVIGAKPD